MGHLGGGVLIAHHPADLVYSAGEEWCARYIDTYWFEGYTYSGDSTVVPITEDPSQQFIGFGNCEAPAGVWVAEGGSMGFFTDGEMVFPSPPPVLEACCDWFGSCTMLDYDTCYDSGGVPYPGEDCATFPCPPSNLYLLLSRWLMCRNLGDRL